MAQMWQIWGPPSGHCPFTDGAKKWLQDNRRVRYTFYPLQTESEKKKKFKEIQKLPRDHLLSDGPHETVPIIILPNGKLLGGFQELKKKLPVVNNKPSTEIYSEDDPKEQQEVLGDAEAFVASSSSSSSYSVSNDSNEPWRLAIILIASMDAIQIRSFILLILKKNQNDSLCKDQEKHPRRFVSKKYKQISNLAVKTYRPVKNPSHPPGTFFISRWIGLPAFFNEFFIEKVLQRYEAVPLSILCTFETHPESAQTVRLRMPTFVDVLDDKECNLEKAARLVESLINLLVELQDSNFNHNCLSLQNVLCNKKVKARWKPKLTGLTHAALTFNHLRFFNREETPLAFTQVDTGNTPDGTYTIRMAANVSPDDPSSLVHRRRHVNAATLDTYVFMVLLALHPKWPQLLTKSSFIRRLWYDKLWPSSTPPSSAIEKESLSFHSTDPLADTRVALHILSTTRMWTAFDFIHI